MATSPRLFIIESLGLSDEKQDRYEGGLLSRMLSLSDSATEYMYLRTRRELDEAIDLFEESKCRYLHFSCHGNKSGIALTFDDVRFDELGKMLGPALEGRRVFFSSCSVMTDRCAAALLPNTGCNSLVGPSANINFDRAAMFWAAFYHLMLRDEARSMDRKRLRSTAGALKNLFDVDIRYYSASKSDKRGFKEVTL